jgi:hypothetical protein
VVGGGVEIGVKANILAVLVPQPFFATTRISPGLFPAVTVIELVPCPAVITQPAGTIQLYSEALLKGTTVYVILA